MNLKKDLMEVDYLKLGNEELGKYVDKIIDRISPKVSNAKILKNMQYKGRLNTQTNQKLKEFVDKVGVYKVGSKKGKLKYSKNLTKKEKIEVARLGRVILNKDIYTTQGRKWKEESALEAYKAFHGENERRTRETQRKLPDDEAKKKQMTYSKEDFDNIVQLYNIMGKKLLEQFGSTDYYGIYDTIKESGAEISNYTILEIIKSKIEQGFTAENGLIDEVWYEVDRLVNAEYYDEED